MDNSNPSLVWFFMLLFILLWFFAIGCWIWAAIDFPKLLKPEGTINRGIKIFTRPLCPEVKQFLLSLNNDIIEYRKTLFWERIAGFIRVKDNEAVIVYRDRWFRSSFIYIGYVDLRLPDPVMEIHTSLPGLLFLLPFVVLIVFIPFVIAMVGVGYYLESIFFNRFLDGKIAEYKSTQGSAE